MSAYTPIAGDIGIVNTFGWVARFIQIGTVSRWNHVFIYIGPTLINGVWYDIIEARPNGVQYGHSADYTNIVWNKHQIFNDEPVDRAFIVAYVTKLIYKPYNWVNIFRIILRIVGFKFFSDTKWMKKVAEKDGYICSELAEEAYEKSGNPLVTKDAGATSPGDLIEAVVYQ